MGTKKNMGNRVQRLIHSIPIKGRGNTSYYQDKKSKVSGQREVYQDITKEAQETTIKELNDRIYH